MWASGRGVHRKGGADPRSCTSLVPYNSCSHLQSIGAYHHHAVLTCVDLHKPKGDYAPKKQEESLDMGAVCAEAGQLSQQQQQCVQEGRKACAVQEGPWTMRSRRSAAPAPAVAEQ
eukprot:1160778-Pelagomonas_calceolata.AAC.5